MSVVVTVPYYNESEGILETLKDINNQEFEADKVIFVDSGSTDKTSDIINDWIKTNDKKNFLNVYSGKMSPSSSINHAIKISNEDIVAYIDCGLSIPSNWLSTSIELLKANDADMISTRIYTAGINKVDRVFVSQTYGYKNLTICFPGSIVKRSVFDKVGTLMSDARASYDTDFIQKFYSKDLKRQINTKVHIKYQDINYTDTFINGFKKVYSYSLNAWNAVGDIKPSLYTITSFIILYLLINSHYALLGYFLAMYVMTRTIIIPLMKSTKSISLILSSSIIYILFAGFTIDMSRMFGYISSFFMRLRIT